MVMKAVVKAIVYAKQILCFVAVMYFLCEIDVDWSRPSTQALCQQDSGTRTKHHGNQSKYHCYHKRGMWKRIYGCW